MSEETIQLPARQLNQDITTRAPLRFTEEHQTPDFNWFTNLFWRRRYIFIGILAGFLTLVVCMTLATPKTYTTTVKLIVGNSSGPSLHAGNDTSLPVLNALVGGPAGRSPETYVELMQEIPVAQRVIDNLKLRTSAGALLGKVLAKPVTDTSIIQLSVTWSDPQNSAIIANEFADVFVERERELIGDQATSAIKFLSTKIPHAHADLQKADAELADYQRGHTGAFVNSATQGVITNLSALQTRLAQVQVDESQAKAQLADVRSQLDSMSPTENAATNTTVNPVVASLQQELAQVDVQLAAARRQYTELHPTVVALRLQQAQLHEQIAGLPQTVVAGRTIAVSPTYEKLREQAAGLEAQIASDEAQTKSLKFQDAQLMRAVEELPTEAVQLADLQRKEKLAESVYTSLEDRYNEAVIAQSATLSDVSITQPALAVLAVKHPSLMMNVMIGLFIGLVLAVSGVFLVEYFDNTFKDERDISRHLPLPVLASVPRVTQRDVKALPWLKTMTADAFLQLIAALRYSSDEPLRSLAVTSPARGDGKSTLALNFAIALADVSPGSVLLVDADLRKPTLHRRTGVVSPEIGLSDVLVGSARLDDAVQTTKYKRLVLLPAGPTVPSPMRLFQTDRFERLCVEMRDKYMYVVIDTPAVLEVFDATLIAAKTDGTVVVIAAGRTEVRQTARAIERLSSIGSPNLLGIVLNQIPPVAKGYGYYTNGYYSQDPALLITEDAITPVV